MNDKLIRQNFHAKVLGREHRDPKTLVLNELGLCHGQCRADIAVVNGILAGYEIKSDKDSLKRLSRQIEAYNAVFDEIVVIAGQRHLSSLVSDLPRWWGIVVCFEDKNNAVDFEIKRPAIVNKQIDAISVARLLWKDEAAEILRRLGEPEKALRESRHVLYERLVEHLELSSLQKRVRQCLKRRKNWRHRAPLFPSDD